jgi:tRNA(Arg) A34 adenosine deaminase TadA
VVNPLQDPRLLHRVEITGGVLADEALSLLQSFFDERR